MQKSKACLVLALLAAGGCGQISDRTVLESDSAVAGQGGAAGFAQGGRAGSVTVMGGQGGMASMPGSGGMPDMLPCNEASSPTPLRALSSWEYGRSVQALTGLAVSQPFPLQTQAAPPFTVSMDLTLPTLEVLFAEAELQGAAARDWTTPNCQAGGTAGACATDLLGKVVAPAFRRPLTFAEEERYQALFGEASAADGLEFGVDVVVEAALLSPQFLYKAYLGDGTVGAGMLTPLTSFELASKLSYLLTGAPPDPELWLAAQNGTLATDEGVMAQALRLMATQQFTEATQHFHAEWFGLDGLDSLPTPGLTDQLRASMRGSADAFIAHAYQGMGRLPDLFLSTTSFLDATLAAHHGVANPAPSGFGGTIINPAYSAGVLTLDSTLTRFNNPTQRGLLVRGRLLCLDVPPPPPSVMTDIEVQPGQTRREAWMQHRENPACAACHQLMDPIGFGFENFDELGRYRTTDNGFAIDSSGEVFGANELDGTFSGLPELAERLSGAQPVAECFVKHWWSYANQRLLTEADACVIQQLTSNFGATLDLRELLTNLVRNPRFRVRDAHIAPAPPMTNPIAGSASDPAARRRLVLDFVLGELQSFLALVPKEDFPLLDQHLSALRELEQKLSQVGPGPEPMP